MFGGIGAGCHASCVTFVSAAGLEHSVGQHLGLRKRLVPVRGTRRLTKKHLPLNDVTPRIEVDPETYQVRADGELLVCEPAAVLPMAQRYFLF
jgi:urease subunit alpha